MPPDTHASPRSAPALSPGRVLPGRSPLAAEWMLDPRTVFLNHGSFGATPRAVLQSQRELRDQLEAEPVRFLVETLEPLLDEARRRLAEFLGGDPAGLVFVPNATHGVNAVLRWLEFEAGDELLTTNHGYNACWCALDAVAARSGAVVRVVDLPWPVREPAEVTRAILESVTPRTKLALIDHVTSPTAMVLPIAEIVAGLEARGVITLVDGAHGPGMVEVDLGAMSPSAYTGNCHKWLCAPKGSGFLWLREDLRTRIKPVAISHGHNSPRTDRSRLHLEFDWTGTADPTAYLCIPAALDVMAGLVPGGWEGVRRANRDLALRGRAVLCERLGLEPAVPESMVGSIASLVLADGPALPGPGIDYPHHLQRRLIERWGVQVPIVSWPVWPGRLVRISAQLYNDAGEYGYLAEALAAELAGEVAGDSAREGRG